MKSEVKPFFMDGATGHYDPAKYSHFAGELVSKHQGWTNFETFLAFTWMERDLEWQKFARHLAEAGSSEEAAQRFFVYFLGLQRGLSNMQPLFLDLFRAALADINYLELANAFREPQA